MKKKTVKAMPIQPLTPERKAFLKDKLDEAMKTQPRIIELRQLLLGIAGEEIVPRPEPHLEQILARGKQWPTKGLKWIKGEPNACHSNIAALWAEDHEDLSIVVGYALPVDDNAWRQHSWAIRNNRIEESTRPYRIYFGAALNDIDAAMFAINNSNDLRAKKRMIIEFVIDHPEFTPGQEKIEYFI